MNGRTIDAIQLLKTILGLKDSQENHRIQIKLIDEQLKALWMDVRTAFRNSDTAEIQRLRTEKDRLQKEVSDKKKDVPKS